MAATTLRAPAGKFEAQPDVANLFYVRFVTSTRPRDAWLRDWLAGTANLSADVGKAFEASIRAQLADAHGHSFEMWDPDEMLGPDSKVSGAVVQRFDDYVMPRFGLTGPIVAAHESERHQVSVRQLIPPTTAKDLPNYLAANLSPSMIRSIEPMFQLTWHDASNAPLLTICLPMKVAP